MYKALLSSVQNHCKFISSLPSLRNLAYSMYSSATKKQKTDQGYVVDFRSDTITKPTDAMRKAMSEAVVGDDVFGEDPTVNELQRKVAKLLKKDAALFVPTGTMSNLIALMSHTTGRGEEVLLGDQCHIFDWEQGGMAQFAGVCPHVVKTLPDGTLDLDELESKIRPSDIHMASTRLICIENTHNSSGGKVLPLEFLQKVRAIADKNNLKVHLDGARLLNAAVAMDVTPDVITQYVDSISICFSKGLGCPVGSALVGSNDFIARALRHRKALGGGMRQCGILAAAALVGLDQGYARLHVDHENAQKFAKGMKELNNPVFTAKPENTQTNMVHILVREDIPSMQAASLLGNVADDEISTLGQSIQVKLFPETDHTMRAVMNHHITEKDVQMALKKFKFIGEKLDKNGLGK
ncbi:probable low-specificity L-threonine aldolase 2 isoform X1 [Strongylocentrotus purpuratus]|uniref:Aromatic amino acid beta-eliminating lyase/threonine aldolase domain-containing protein n=1 Tax=Strongylocentrotus purpuratus TaxID=7668 RepID=A0A7M7NS00_STRPU|nr:probable low-specificity L-threonine aldolase 2 isoform X1 [Strongylocentrotus purpuratus]